MQRTFQSREKEEALRLNVLSVQTTKSRRKVFRPSSFKGKKETFFTDLEGPAHALTHKTRATEATFRLYPNGLRAAHSPLASVSLYYRFHDASTRRSGGWGQETAASVAAVHI